MKSEYMLVGRTKHEMVYVSFSEDRGTFSVCGRTFDVHGYSLTQVEEFEMSRFWDSGCWEDAVASGKTELGKAEFYEDWSEDIDLSEWKPVYTSEGKELWFQQMSGGQIDMHVSIHDFVYSAIPMKDLRYIWFAWERYHLMNVKDVPDVVLDTMRDIFICWADGDDNEHDDIFMYMIDEDYKKNL